MIDLNDITIDLARITIREYRALFDGKHNQADEDAIIAKVAGITVDELLELPQPDYRRLLRRFFEAAAQPVDDPN